jgi:hypothetical protein
MSTVALSKKELWLRLRQYQFDHLVPAQLTDHVAAIFGSHDASARAFAGKLRRKLGWSGGLARLAIDEYKKFLFQRVPRVLPGCAATRLRSSPGAGAHGYDDRGVQ